MSSTLTNSTSTPVLPNPSETKVDRAKQQLAEDRALLAEHCNPLSLRRDNVDWIVTIFIGAMHVGCLAAPFFFSWSALGVCIFLHWLTCSIGVCLGYHRYLSHRSMKLRRPADFFVMLCGVLSGEGSPLTWAATHRMHHQLSDQKGDPHSPNDGKWWSHMLWLVPAAPKRYSEVLLRRYVPELLEKPVLRFFERTYPWWLLISGLSLMGIGALISGWYGAISMLVWGMCVRMTLAYHTTWLINSATHLWGYRNYETRDMSRNLWWVAILAYGEGWHNNHHAHPRLAPAGHRWWEVDITWWSIKLLRRLGLATDVCDKIPENTRQAAHDAMD